MTDVEKNLLRRAHEMHSTIFPCPPGKDFKYCFTRDQEKIYFWFNTEDRSTHVIAADLKN